MRGRTRSLAAIAGIGLLLAGSACRASGLAWREDRRLRIDAPGKNAVVTLPLEVRWHVRDLPKSLQGRPYSYALFLDRFPQAPGKTLQQFDAGSKNLTQSRVGIIEARESRHVFTTIPPHDARQRDKHELTVILVDENGRRVGETAGFLTFRVAQGGTR
jgi:hypothetical protein